MGHVVRHVNMPLQGLGLSSLYSHPRSLAFQAHFVWFLTLLPSRQLMSVVGNLLYMGLAVMGGLWMPLASFRMDASHRQMLTNLPIN